VSLLVFFATSMFSSQSAFAGGVCFTDNDCTANDGNECTGPVECFAGICVQPPLTDTDCGSGPDPNGCSGQDICVAGSCIFPNHVPIGVSCNNGDGQTCTGACNGFGSCGNGPGTGEPCDDGAQCTIGDSCVVGECVGSPKSLGTACNDDNSCTSGDSCNLVGVCNPGVPLTGTDCGAGGTQCSAQDTCDSGTCVPSDLTGGTACGDSTNTECKNPDSCDGSGNCQSNDEPDNTSCDDGELCTIDELCKGGICTMGTINTIPACIDTVGGEIIPIESTSLILAGTQSTFSWMIPITVSAIGVAIVIARKF